MICRPGYHTCVWCFQMHICGALKKWLRVLDHHGDIVTPLNSQNVLMDHRASSAVRAQSFTEAEGCALWAQRCQNSTTEKHPSCHESKEKVDAGKLNADEEKRIFELAMRSSKTEIV
ncbi:Uncharacterized protein DAT39_011819 [Clarias magur]|uniref:Uncharacterized protein n=1 Tax=Clarias magur TaxID=1594786 RepID=A0A8J4X2H0_CLAMG|nr:Uncharacterized protein DAT39_011819 [Clarias magur]